MTHPEPHGMPEPDRLDALLDGHTPRDDAERDAVAFAAALREATPGAPDDLRRRVAGLATDVPARPPRRRGRAWLPWGGAAVAAGAVAAAVTGIAMTGGGGDGERLALRTGGGTGAEAVEAAPYAGAPSAEARDAAPAAPASTAAGVAPAPAAPAPSRSTSGSVVSVRVPRAGRASRLAAAFAATRARGLVLGHGTVATGAPVPAYAVSSVLAAGPPHELGRALRAVVARPASVSATPGDRALARAVMAAVAAPSDAGRRRVLARRERQAGATPPPIASGAPVTIVFRLP